MIQLFYLIYVKMTGILFNKWIKNIKYICMDTIECYSAIEKKEVLSFVTTRVTLKGLC